MTSNTIPQAARVTIIGGGVIGNLDTPFEAGLGYVQPRERPTRAYLQEGRWEIEVALERHSARASLRPLYDPQGKRIKS